MKVKEDHRLYFDDDKPVSFVPSPNLGGTLTPLYLMMHYTAGSTAEGAIAWLCNPRKDDPTKAVSAHLVISRTGEITQLVPFNRIAWHAGYSWWEGRSGINRFAIGIEMDNDGILTQSPTGEWISKAGGVIPTANKMTAPHWKLFGEHGWVIYPEAQYQAALEAGKAIVERYQLVDVVGHEDTHVAKIDPGPAFPMPKFRQELFGREQALVQGYVTTRAATIYEDVGGQPPPLPPRLAISPLAPGTPATVIKNVVSTKIHKVEKPQKPPKPGKKAEKKKPDVQIIKQEDTWSLVRVQGNVQGWVKQDAVKNKLTTGTVEIFKHVGKVPDPEPPRHKIKLLPEGTKIRLLEQQGNMALVGLREELPKYKYLQGWVFWSDIQKEGDLPPTPP